MIDYQKLYHTGVRVPDLDAAMAEIGATLGVTWASVVTNPGQQVWTPEDGLQEVPLRFTYSCEGPQHIELLEGAPGSVWDGRQAPGVHHVGVWVDDVAAETTRLLDAGWSLRAAQAPPDQGYGVFTYVQPPTGMLVELVWSVVAPRFEQWWAGGGL